MKFRNPLADTTAMTIAGAFRAIIQVAILPIIGRLLGPHAYGQIALVSPFIFFSMLLAESGLGVCIVRVDKLSNELEGTVFCFSALLSLIFILIFSLLSFPLGVIFHDPLFPYLLISMSSILLLASFNIVPSALLLRSKKYNWIALADILSTIGGVAAVLFGIYLDWGVWSLVGQQIVFWLCKVAVVIIGSNYRPKFILKTKLIRENIYFGSNLTGASILSFIARNIDNILIGAFLGAQALGYYALAFQIVGLPQMVIAGSIYYTLFVSSSEAYRKATSNTPHFLIVLRGVVLISAPIAIGIASTASLSVPLFLGEKWLPMINLIVLLTPLGLCQTVGAALTGVLVGLGRTEITFRLTALTASATILAILAGIYINSAAVAIGVSLTSIMGFCLTLRATLRECDIRYREALRASAPPLLASIIMGILVWIASILIPTTYWLIGRLIVCIILGIIIYCSMLFVFFHQTIQADFKAITVAILSSKRKRYV